MQSYHLWPFVSGLFHSACCSQGLPMWSHVSVLPSLFKAEYYFVVGRGYTSFICSSTSGHLGCFHFSAVHWIICTLVYQRESCHISFHYLNFKRSGNLGWREHSQFWMETKPTSSAVTTVDRHHSDKLFHRYCRGKQHICISKEGVTSSENFSAAKPIPWI